MSRFDVVCAECGKQDQINSSGNIADLAQRLGLCWTCAFWTQLIEERDAHVFVEGSSYLIGDERAAGMRGFGGGHFLIRFHDGRPDVSTTNLWCQGKIPERFRDRLPDTAVFVR